MATPFLDTDLPPGSYAWCSDCPWRDESKDAHRNGRLHCDSLHHLVHCYVPDCGEPLVENGTAYSCHLDRGHTGPHEDGAKSW